MERLRETIRALERGDAASQQLQHQHDAAGDQSGITDQAVPWGLAYALAVQREAATLPFNTCPSGHQQQPFQQHHQPEHQFSHQRGVSNRHKVPASMLNASRITLPAVHSGGGLGGTAAGAATTGFARRPDPLTRTAALAPASQTGPSWREAVCDTSDSPGSPKPRHPLSQGLPAVQAGSTGVPRAAGGLGAPPQPGGMGLPAQGGGSSDPSGWGFGGGSPSRSQPTRAPGPGSTVTSGAAAGREPELGAGVHERQVLGGAAGMRPTADSVLPSGYLLPGGKISATALLPGGGPVQSGWGATATAGLAEVPESFWQVVAPGVHSDISEFLAEKEQQQQQQRRAPLRPKQLAAQPRSCAQQPTQALQPHQLPPQLPPPQLPPQLPPPQQQQQQQQQRRPSNPNPVPIPSPPAEPPLTPRGASEPVSTAGVSDSMPGPAASPSTAAPGTSVMAKWLLVDGTFEWRACTVLATVRADEDGLLSIQWDHNGARRTVSRVNLWLEGNTAGGLGNLGPSAKEGRAAAQAASSPFNGIHLCRADSDSNSNDWCPPPLATAMPAPILDNILHRLGTCLAQALHHRDPIQAPGSVTHTRTPGSVMTGGGGSAPRGSRHARHAPRAAAGGAAAGERELTAALRRPAGRRLTSSRGRCMAARSVQPFRASRRAGGGVLSRDRTTSRPGSSGTGVSTVRVPEPYAAPASGQRSTRNVFSGWQLSGAVWRHFRFTRIDASLTAAVAELHHHYVQAQLLLSGPQAAPPQQDWARHQHHSTAARATLVSPGTSASHPPLPSPPSSSSPPRSAGAGSSAAGAGSSIAGAGSSIAGAGSSAAGGWGTATLGGWTVTAGGCGDGGCGESAVAAAVAKQRVLLQLGVVLPRMGCDLFVHNLGRLQSAALSADPAVLCAWQAAWVYLCDIRSREMFGMRQLPLHGMFRGAEDDKQPDVRRYRQYLEGRRRPAYEDEGSASLPFGADTIDLVSFLSIQEGVRYSEVRDIVTRVIRQLSNIVMDAAECSSSMEQGSHHTCGMARTLPLVRQHQRQLKRAGLTEAAAGLAAAAAAGALIPQPRAAGLAIEELAEAERNIIDSHTQSEGSGAGGDGPGAFGAQAVTTAAAAAAATTALAQDRSCVGKALEGGGPVPDRPAEEWDELERRRGRPEGAGSVVEGTEMGGGGVPSELGRPSSSCHSHQESFYRLASSLNVALHCTLRQWVLENIQAYAAALCLYLSPSYIGVPLFHVVLDVIDGALCFTPPARHRHAEAQGVRGTDAASGGQHPGAAGQCKGECVCARSPVQRDELMFTVLPDLRMPPALPADSPALVEALDDIARATRESAQRCHLLQSDFTRHLLLLGADGALLHETVGASRSVVGGAAWTEAIQRYRDAEADILSSLPAEAHLGLFRVDCRSLRRRMSESARRLADTVLLSLQVDAHHAAGEVIAKLQGAYDAITQPLTELGVVLEVKGRLSRLVGLLAEAAPELTLIRTNAAIMHTFRHTLPENVMSDMWEALRLPALIGEVSVELSSAMGDHERRCLDKLGLEKDSFDDAVKALAAQLAARNLEFDEELCSLFEASCEAQAADIKAALDTANHLNKQELIAGLEQTDYSIVSALKCQLVTYHELWKMVASFRAQFVEWMYGPLFAFEMEPLETALPGWVRMATKLDKQLTGEPQQVARRYHRKLVEFEGHMPLLRALRTPGLRQRHWARVYDDLPALAAQDRSRWTLHGMLQLDMHHHASLVRDAAELASRELAIEQSVSSVSDAFYAMLLVFAEDTASGFSGVHALTNGEELLKQLDDAQLRIKSLCVNFYVEPHKDVVAGWDELLCQCSLIVDSWIEVQNKWGRIAPLFGGQLLMRQLPLEGKRFTEITAEWKDMLGMVRSHCRVGELARHSSLAARLNAIGLKLEVVNKGVAEFLEVKRSSFPRFYFLSSHEMVDMLIGSQDTAAMEPYLQKCFPGIKGLCMAQEGGLRAEALISPEGETLPLVTSVDLQDPVSGLLYDMASWMAQLERQMVAAMKHALRVCVEAQAVQRFEDWILAWPAQCVLLASGLDLSRDVAHIHKSALAASSAFQCLGVTLQAQILLMVGLLLTHKLTTAQRGVLENVVITKVHHKDVAARLASQRAASVEDLEWLRILRFDTGHDALVVVHCGYTQLPFGYEYLGNTPRLVITPLTERAFSTMMAAVALHLGAAPEGPAARSVLPSNLKALFRPVAMMVPDYKLIAEVSLYAAGFQTAASLATKLVSCLTVAHHRLSHQTHYDFAMRTLKAVLLIAAGLRITIAASAAADGATPGPLTVQQEASVCKVALLRYNLSKLQDSDVPVFRSVVEQEFPEPEVEDKDHEGLALRLAQAARTLGLHPSEELLLRAVQLYELLPIRTGVMLLGPAAGGKTTVRQVLQLALSKEGRALQCAHIYPKAVSSAHLYGSYNSSHQSWRDGVLTHALRQAVLRGAGWILLDGPVDPVWVEALNPVLDDNKTLCLSSGETVPLRGSVNLILEVDSIAFASPATVSRCGIVYMHPNTGLWREVLHCWAAKIRAPIQDLVNRFESLLDGVFPDILATHNEYRDLNPASLPHQQGASIMKSLLRILDSFLPQIEDKILQEAEDDVVMACLEAALLISLVWAFEAALPHKARPFLNILVRQMTAKSSHYHVMKEGVSVEVTSIGFAIPLPSDGYVYDFMFDFGEIRWVHWGEHVKALQDLSRIPTGPAAFIPFGLNNLIGQGTSDVRSSCFVFTADNLPAIYLMRLLVAHRHNVLLVGPTGTGKTALTSALLDSARDWLSVAEGEAPHRASNSPAPSPLDGPAPAQQSTAALQAADPGGLGEGESTTHMLASMAATITPRSPRDECGWLCGWGLRTPTRSFLCGTQLKEPPPPPLSVLMRAVNTSTGATLRSGGGGGGGGGGAAKGSPLDVLPLTLSSQSTAARTKAILESHLTRRGRNLLGPPVGKVAVVFVDDLHAPPSAYSGLATAASAQPGANAAFATFPRCNRARRMQQRRELTMPGYTTRELIIGVGGLDYRMRVLTDLQQFADPHHFAERYGISSAMWGLFGQVWPSSRVMAEAMATYEVRGKRILELIAWFACPAGRAAAAAQQLPVTICSGGWRSGHAAGGGRDQQQLPEAVSAAPLMRHTVSDARAAQVGRLLQHVSLITLAAISSAGFQLIFTAMLNRHMAGLTSLSVGLASQLVEATMALYKQVTTVLLPVPAHPHYLFSVRHVAAVFQAMFSTTHSSRSVDMGLVRLWQHESCRVFHDRIVDAPSRAWFLRTLHKISQDVLGEACPPAQPDGEDITFCSFASLSRDYELSLHVLKAAAQTVEDVPSESGTPSDGAAADTPDSAAAAAAAAHEASPAAAAAGKPRGTAGQSILSRKPRVPISAAGGGRKKAGADARRVPNATTAHPPKADGMPPDSATNSAPTVNGGADAEGHETTRRKALLAANPLLRVYDRPWADNGRPVNDLVLARLQEVCQAQADMYVEDLRSGTAALGAHGRGGSSTSAVSESGLVVFSSCVVQLARICRVLAMDQGHMMLMGQPGSGRRTLVRLACYIAGCDRLESNLQDSGKAATAWHDLLKQAMHTAGVTGRPVCLLLKDVGRHSAGMLDDVTHLLSSGQLPGLFKAEELTAIVGSMRPVAKTAGLRWNEHDRSGASDTVLRRLFVDRCRANLHIIMVLEYDEAALQRAIVSFPKMFHLTAINMVHEWDHSARLQVARHMLGSASALGVTDEEFTSVANAAVAAHESVRGVAHRYNIRQGYRSAFIASGCHYLDFLGHIKILVPERQSALSHARQTHLAGVGKMVEMQAGLSALQRSLAGMTPELARSKEDADRLGALLQQERSDAEAALQRLVAREAAEQGSLSRKSALARQLDEELRLVLPPLVGALRELRHIDKRSISELKAMRKPPSGVKLVMRAICVLLGLVPAAIRSGQAATEDALVQAWWDESVRALGDLHFLDKLRSYDKEALRDDVAEEIALFVAHPQFDSTAVLWSHVRSLPPPCPSSPSPVQLFVAHPQFDSVEMARTSAAAAWLSAWVRAIHRYQGMRKLVEPKQRALARAGEELQEQVGSLSLARAELRSILDAAQSLQQAVTDSLAESEGLRRDMAGAAAKLAQAEAVTSAVSREVARWEGNAARHAARAHEVIGEALLCAATLSYLGPVSGTTRMECGRELAAVLAAHGLRCPTAFSLSECLSDPLQLEAWRGAALPQSRSAVDGATIMGATRSWCLLLDPQELGVNFLKQLHAVGADHGPVAQAVPSRKGLALLETLRARAAARATASTVPAASVRHSLSAAARGGPPAPHHKPSGEPGAPQEGKRSSLTANAPRQRFVTLDQSEPAFREGLLRAVEEGALLLVENFDEHIDEALEQVLACVTFTDHLGRACLMVGEQSVLHDQNFRLFLATRLPNPQFPFEVTRHLSVVSFAVTQAQLGELLITATLKHEAPELEQEHTLLVRQKSHSDVELGVLESQMLEAISLTTSEELLGQSEVHQMLVALQNAATSIKAEALRMDENQRTINEFRSQIERLFVSRVVPFFFVLTDLANVRCFYQFGLQWFLALFRDALATCVRRSDSGPARLHSLTTHFTATFYANVSRSLLDDDKLPFAVLMLVRFLLASGEITRDESNLLLFGRATDTALTAKPTLVRLASSRGSNPRRKQHDPNAAPSHPAMKQGGKLPRALSGSGITMGLSLAETVTVEMQGAGDAAAIATVATATAAIAGKQGSAAGAVLDAAGSSVDPNATSGSRSSSGAVASAKCVASGGEGVGEEDEEDEGSEGGQTTDAFDGLFRGRQRSRSRLGRSSVSDKVTTCGGETPGRSASVLSPPDAADQQREIKDDQAGDERAHAAHSAVSELEAGGSARGDDAECRRSVGPGGGAPSEPPRPGSANGMTVSSPGAEMSGLAAPGLAAPGPAAGSKARTGPQLPDFLEMSAPAKMQDFKRPDYMSEDSWVRLRDLGKLWPYNKLLSAMVNDSQVMASPGMGEWYRQLAAVGMDAIIPDDRIQSLSSFQKLLFIRCFQPRAFISAAQASIAQVLGPSCAVATSLDLDAAFAASTASSPIVVVSASDHTLPRLMRFAEQKGIATLHLAMGRGQGPAIDQALRAAVGTERWAILDNCHLAGDWMPRLCRLVQSLPSLPLHTNFRLWLTTRLEDTLPAAILQASLKLVMDPPQGLKANLAQVLSQLPMEVAANSRCCAAQTLASSSAAQRTPRGGADPGDASTTTSPRGQQPPAQRASVVAGAHHAGGQGGPRRGADAPLEAADPAAVPLPLDAAGEAALRGGWRGGGPTTSAPRTCCLACNRWLTAIFSEGLPPQSPPVATASRCRAASPGLLYVDGQCLYGGRVTHDWDRRLLVTLLSQHLLPGLATSGLGPAPTATVGSLLPERLASCGMDLHLVMKELQSVSIPTDQPELVGLCNGAANVRHLQLTRHVLDTLKRVQLMQTSEDMDTSKPLQIALSVATDVSKALPQTVLPTIRNGWILLVGADPTLLPTGPGSNRGDTRNTTHSPARTTPPSRPQSTTPDNPGARLQQQTSTHARPNRMHDDMSPAAKDRWMALDIVTQRMFVQVYNDELRTYQRMLTAVHATASGVGNALRGLEPMSPPMQALVRQLASNEVPEQWRAQRRVEMNSESISAWLADLTARLGWLCEWGTEGPPMPMPLGMLSRPKMFLTALQQVHAQRLLCPMGSLHFEVQLLAEDEDSADFAAADSAGLAGIRLHTSNGGEVSAAEAQSTGALISGLVLQGARWDGGMAHLCEAEPGVVCSRLPLLWLRATSDFGSLPESHLTGSQPPCAVNGRYLCPIYKYQAVFGSKHTLGDDDDCLLCIALPCGQHSAAHWVTRSVAMLVTPDPSLLVVQSDQNQV
ncbi:MAG: hypothetical protein WDW36_003791 [Sanguina aurantia]